MRYARMLLLTCVLFLVAAGAPPDAAAPPKRGKKTPDEKKAAKPLERHRFGDIKPREREALTVESRGKYAEAIAIYWDCFADSVKAAQAADARGKNAEKDFEIAMQEFFIEKATCLTGDLANRPINIKKLEEASEMPGVDPYVKGRILHELMLAVGASGDIRRVRKIRDRLGIITKWAIVGPFDNERGRGFGQEYGPEKRQANLRIEKKEGDAVHKVWYDGKVRKVEWRMIPVEDPFGIVDLDVLLRPNDQVLAYALAFIYSNAEQDAAVRIASDEGCTVWVNGENAITRDLERTIEFDQDSAAVRLARGWNSVLV